MSSVKSTWIDFSLALDSNTSMPVVYWKLKHCRSWKSIDEVSIVAILLLFLDIVALDYLAATGEGAAGRRQCRTFPLSFANQLPLEGFTLFHTVVSPATHGSSHTILLLRVSFTLVTTMKSWEKSILSSQNFFTFFSETRHVLFARLFDCQVES